MKASLGSHSSLRLQDRSQWENLDTSPEGNFEDLVNLAAYICETPVALIYLVDGERVLIKSKVGIETTQAQQCQDFCDRAIAQTDLFIVQDATCDERFANNRAVKLNPKIRFWAGAPLVTSQGAISGILCVMDYVPRELSWEQRKAFQALSRQVVSQFKLHGQLNHQRHNLISVKPMASKTPWDIVDIFESITDAFVALDWEWRITYLNSRAEQVLLRTRNELIGKNFWDELPEAVGSILAEECQRAVSKRVNVHFEQFYPPLGIWLEVRAYPFQGGLSVYFRDVTARKQAEAMLMERSRLSAFGAEIGIALGQGGTIPDILNRCTQIVVDNLDATNACIFSVKPGTEELQLQAIALATHSCTDVYSGTACLAEKPQQAAACDWLHPDSSIVDFIAKTRHPYLTNSLAERDPLGVKAWLQRIGACSCNSVQAFAAYPLIVEERLVGIMALCSRQGLSEEGHSMLEWVANAIAVAIDRAWARSELLSRRESLLFSLASQIRNSLDLDTILGTAVNEIRSLLQIDRTDFLWCWPQLEQPSLTVTHEACLPTLPSLLGDYPGDKVSNLVKKILDLETIRIDDISGVKNLDEQTQTFLKNLGITSQLLIPLETHSGQLGAIVCSHSSGARPWSDSEVELLKAVVDQLAIAIDQAELYAQTRAAAFAAQSQAQQLTHALQHLKQTEAQLVHTEKMSSLGQMVAGIAHEINNPINFIYGNLDHASSYIEDLLGLLHMYQEHYPKPAAEIEQETDRIDFEFIKDDLPKLLASMQVGTERIRQIVLSLRNFSRLDEAEKKPVNIHEGIDNTLLIIQNRLKGSATKPEIQVIKEYSELPAVECYAGQLNQVFMNILSNAIDALENQPEPRKITIRTSLDRSQGAEEIPTPDTPHPVPNSQFVVIRIADNGPGMTEEVRKCLFDPFFTTKPVGKGTGLGLSISYQIVAEKHGGQLRCVSALGRGAEFIVEIPV